MSISIENVLSASAFEFGRDQIALINFVIVEYLNVLSAFLIVSIVFHALLLI